MESIELVNEVTRLVKLVMGLAEIGEGLFSVEADRSMTNVNCKVWLDQRVGPTAGAEVGLFIGRSLPRAHIHRINTCTFNVVLY